MAVTAAKLGAAPLALDWSDLSRIPAGTGKTSRPVYPDAEAIQDAWKRLKTRFDSGEVGFYDAPLQDELSQLEASTSLAAELLKKGFSDCLVLGIGGSALGPISLLSALQERRKTGLRFHFMENPDPVDWKTTLGGLNPDSTFVCVVTKSGGTFETVAQFLLALEWLGESRWRSNLVAITDPEKGDLKAFARQFEIPTLHIAPSIGGRFSIFSPVGLFPAALAGLSVQDFLQGARQVRDHMEKAAPEKNPLFILGHSLIAHFSQRPIHVCMPYSTRLRSIGDWFVQLWGESLGKNGKGFTPVAAVGATDQHSILQLLRDGPDDKVTMFVTVDRVADEARIPKTIRGVELNRFGSFSLLKGHSLHELLSAEYRATSLVLTRQNRPHVSFKLDQLDERNLGALYYATSVLTAFTGTLWDVNPFDQPGVEEGKVYTRQTLSDEIANT